MNGLKLLFATMLVGVSLYAHADAAPKYIVVEPLCAPTAHWNLNAGGDAWANYPNTANDGIYLEGKLCGCEPLAWAQILTYYGLQKRIPSDWTMRPVTANVTVGSETKSRTTGTAVRTDNGETDTWTGYTWGTDLVHAERLVYDIGVLGKAQYGSGITILSNPIAQKDDETYDSETQTMSNDMLLTTFYGFMKGSSWKYGPRPDFSYWNESFTEALLRGSLQAGAPVKLGTLEPLHAFICDGYGYDEEGKAYFHLNYGWGGSSNTWVPTSWFYSLGSNYIPNVSNLYINVQPEDVKCVVAGVVSQNRVPLAGVTVTLTGDSLTEAKTLTTDAKGAYAFTGLDPEKTYQVAVNGSTQTVTTGKFVDEQLQTILQNEQEKLPNGKDLPAVEAQHGHAVADFNFEVTVQTSDSLWAVWDDFSALTADAPLAPTVAFKVGDVDASAWRFKLNGGTVDGTTLQTGTGIAPLIDFGESIDLGWEHTPYTVVITVKDIPTVKDLDKPFWMAGSQIGFGLQTKSDTEMIVEGMWTNAAYPATRWDAGVPTGSVTFAVNPSSSYRAVVVGDKVTQLGASSALRGSSNSTQYLYFGNFASATSEGLNYTIEKVAIFRGTVTDEDLLAFCNENTWTFHSDVVLSDVPDGTTIASAGGTVDVSALSPDAKVTLKVNLANVWHACKPFSLPEEWTWSVVQVEGDLPELLTKHGWLSINKTTGEITSAPLSDPLPYELTWMPMGDSITEGEVHMASTDGNTGTRGGYRYQLWKALEENGQPTRSFGFRTGHQGTEEVVNNPKWAWHCGLYGGLIKPIDNSGAHWYNVETALENAGYPDVITLMLGINDLSYLSSDDDAGITDVFTAWTQLVTKLAKNRPHSKILVTTLLPVVNGNKSDGRFGPFNEKIRAAYQKKTAPFDNANVFFVDVCDLAFENTHHSVYSKDGIHPNEEGSIITAYAFREGMQDVIDAIRAEPLSVVTIHNGVAGEVRVRLNKPLTAFTGAQLTLTTADGNAITLTNAQWIEQDETIVPKGGSVDADGRVIAFDLGDQQLTAGSYTASIRAELNDAFGSTALSCTVPATDIEIVGSGAAENIPAAFLSNTYVKHSTITIGNDNGAPTIDTATEVPEVIGRVGYYMELKRPDKPAQFVWVSMDATAFGRDPAKVGLPSVTTGAHKAIVADLEVYGNRGNFEKSVTGARGIIEFTPWGWDVADESGYVNEVRSGHMGWNDTLSTSGTTYGCMQVARIHEDAKGTWLDPAAEFLFAYNYFNSSTMSDLGIGSFSPHWNNIGSQSIRPVKYDWTGISSVNQYTQYQPDAYEVKKIEVWVQEGEPLPPLTWTGTTETWDATSKVWARGDDTVAFTDGEEVQFLDIEGKTATTAAPSVNVAPASILIDNAATEVTLGSTTAALIGNPIITKKGTGKVILRGPNASGAATRIAEFIQEDGTVQLDGDYVLLTGQTMANLPVGSKLTIKGGTFDLNGSHAYSNAGWLTESTITLGGSTVPARIKGGDIIPYTGSDTLFDFIVYVGGDNVPAAHFEANLHSVFTNSTRTRNIVVGQGLAAEGYDLEISGILGSGGQFNGTTLIKKGLGTLKLSNQNNIPGLSITEGTLLCGNDGALSATTTLATNATLDLANTSPTVTTLTLNAGSTLAVGTGTLTATTVTVAGTGTVTIQPSTALTAIASPTYPLTVIADIGDVALTSFTLGDGFISELYELVKTDEGALQVAQKVALDVPSPNGNTSDTTTYTQAAKEALFKVLGKVPTAVTAAGNGKRLNAEEVSTALACFEGITQKDTRVDGGLIVGYTFGVTKMTVGEEVAIEVGVSNLNGDSATFAKGVVCELLFVDLETGKEKSVSVDCDRQTDALYKGSYKPTTEHGPFMKARVKRN